MKKSGGKENDSEKREGKNPSFTGSRWRKDGEKKKKKKKKKEPPFLLYECPSKPTLSEGLCSVANLLRGRKNIAVLTGAGISVSCGIPDFRSKDVGLYSTLDTEELGLSCPEELFDWEVFQENPIPFFKFARNLYFPRGNNDNGDERVRPSDSHKLLALMERNKMLLRVYSQNIDGLEQEAGVSPKKIVYAHGSLKWATCLRCKRKVSSEEIEDDILNGSVARCRAAVGAGGNRFKNRNGIAAAAAATRPAKPAPSPVSTRQSSSRTRKRPRPDDTGGRRSDRVCNGVLKPGVTFFGEVLHDNVGRCLESDRDKVDALIVIGTSLSVAPISKVIGYLPPNIPRILINRNIVHPVHESTACADSDDDDEEEDFRNGYVFDAYLLGYCDDVTRILARHLFSATDESSSSRDEKTAEDDGEDDGDESAARLLATLGEDDDLYDAKEWESATHVPRERVFLFPGAQPPSKTTARENDKVSTKDDDADAAVTSFREIAHCDGCSERIRGTIQKCSVCFDYDLCPRCFPTLSKAHHDGGHRFYPERAASSSSSAEGDRGD